MDAALRGVVEATGPRGRAAARDADFADVFATHARDAVRLATLLTGDPHRAEDLVSEASPASTSAGGAAGSWTPAPTCAGRS